MDRRAKYWMTAIVVGLALLAGIGVGTCFGLQESSPATTITTTTLDAG